MQHVDDDEGACWLCFFRVDRLCKADDGQSSLVDSVLVRRTCCGSSHYCKERKSRSRPLTQSGLTWADSG